MADRVIRCNHHITPEKERRVHKAIERAITERVQLQEYVFDKRYPDGVLDHIVKLLSHKLEEHTVNNAIEKCSNYLVYYRLTDKEDK